MVIALAPTPEIAAQTGVAVVFAFEEGGVTPTPTADADAAMGGALAKARNLGVFKGKLGEVLAFPAPTGMAAERVLVVGAGAENAFDYKAARALGGHAAAALSGVKSDAMLYADGLRIVATDNALNNSSDGTSGGAAIAGAAAAAAAAEIALGAALRGYTFDVYHTASDAPKPVVRVAVADPAAAEAAHAARAAVAEGVAFTRDLVNEPANVLTPPEFAARLEALRDLGVEVEVLDDDAMGALGMNALLGVAQGSEQPARLVVMKWMKGDPDAAPACFVGKGVTFDTGGISIKPSGGMEEMTMDMGGAGVVSGLMKTLALRKAKANVVGLVGLVENMPDGRAQRPGDIVTSMAGKTIEIINTDAEGRLVLADVLWYAQDRFKPASMINLATLTGAMIIALGYEKAGFFANDDQVAERLTAAAAAEGEGLWRMPLGEAYDKKLKSRLADMKNTGGRDAGSITAAQFLQRFVNDAPWAHIDIAGVTLPKDAGPLRPKGASGWGVATLNRYVADYFES